MAGKAVSVEEVFDTGISSYQIGVCVLCFLVTLLDGLDLTVVGVAIPKIAEFLHTKPGAFGIAMSASSVGAVIGSVVLGMAADRFGRKWMLSVSAFIFGLFTLLTVWITSVGELTLFRFIAGLGLGGAIPNALAYGSEYAPSSLRKTFVTTMFAGMPVGAMLGGLIGAWFIPRFGWPSLFVLGGGIHILISFVTAAVLPESLEFLVQKGKDKVRIRHIVAKIAPALAKDEEVEFRSAQKKLPGAPLKNLFTERRALMTILFWIVLVGGGYLASTLSSWAPTLLHKSGASVVQYSLAFAAYNFGSIVAFILVGRLLDLSDSFIILPIGFVLGFASLVGFGWVAGSSLLIVACLSVACGFFINGSQTGTLGLATVSYPTSVRGAAVGSAYAAARVGTIIAPLAGGHLLNLGWSVTRICSTSALAALVSAVFLLALRGRVAAAARYQAEQTTLFSGTNRLR